MAPWLPSCAGFRHELSRAVARNEHLRACRAVEERLREVEARLREAEARAEDLEATVEALVRASVGVCDG